MDTRAPSVLLLWGATSVPPATLFKLIGVGGGEVVNSWAIPDGWHAAKLGAVADSIETAASLEVSDDLVVDPEGVADETRREMGVCHPTLARDPWRLQVTWTLDLPARMFGPRLDLGARVLPSEDCRTS